METLETEQTLLDNMEMYEISGYSEITSHSRQRYLRDKEQQEHKIVEKAKYSPHFVELKVVMTAPTKRAELIAQGLESEIPRVRRSFADNIKYAMIDDEIDLREKVYESVKNHLNDEDENTQLTSAKMIPNALPERRGELLKKAFETNNPKIQTICAKIVKDALPEEQASLLNQGLTSDNPEVIAEFADMTWTLQEDEKEPIRKKVAEIISKSFEGSNIEEQRILADLIRIAPEEDRRILIHKGLDIPDPEVQITSAGMIWSVFPNSENELLKEKVGNIVEESIENGNPSLARMVESLSEKQRTFLIKKGFNHDDIEIRKAFTNMSHCISQKEFFDFAKSALEDPEEEIQAIMTKKIIDAPKDCKENLVNIIISKGLGDFLIQPPLYKEKSESFNRTKFEKTGSGTTLLGGDFEGKVIIRHIKPEAFLSWQRLFENYQMWKNEGFDYVPIEPIFSFKLNKNDIVDTYSAVLDVNLATWRKTTEMYNRELVKQEKKILAVLEKENVDHGHPHSANFCLRFFRNENGKVNLSKTPRVYLIDFDQAKSPPRD
jgi:hypothetical protein